MIDWELTRPPSRTLCILAPNAAILWPNFCHDHFGVFAPRVDFKKSSPCQQKKPESAKIRQRFRPIPSAVSILSTLDREFGVDPEMWEFPAILERGVTLILTKFPKPR
jgi:hypothetical protein